MKKNPFISEFSKFPWLQRFFLYEKCLSAAFYIFFIALVPLVFGFLAGTNCMEVTLSTAAKTPTISISFGFLAEPNHGFFYLFGAPIFFIAIVFFLEGAGSAFLQLANNKTLTLKSDDVNKNVLDHISDQNRTLFLKVLWIVPLIILVIIFGTEWPIREKPMFGWVQASILSTKINNKTLDKIEVSETPQIIDKWGSEFKKNTVTVTLKKPDLSKNNVQEQLDRWFYFFLITALLVESFTIMILAWAGLKMLFIVWILRSATWINKQNSSQDQINPGVGPEPLTRKKEQYQLALDFLDEKKRFGIGFLDSVYNLALLIGLMVAIIFWIGRISNMAKGSAFVLHGDPFLLGPLLIASSVLLATGSICVYPFFHLVRTVARIQNDMAEDQAYSDKSDLIREQNLWPGLDSRYMALATFCFILVLLLPIGLNAIVQMLEGDKAAAAIENFAKVMPQLLCSW